MIYIGLGSNIGNRENYIDSAIKKIESLVDTNVIKSSSKYRTEPWGIKSQDEFINIVIEIGTKLEPSKLLKEFKKIELLLGRKNREKWFKREIDIDILFYDNIILNNKYIQIPHPEIQNRKFVLVPLCELNSNFIHPVLNEKLIDLLKKTNDKSKVIKL